MKYPANPYRELPFKVMFALLLSLVVLASWQCRGKQTAADQVQISLDKVEKAPPEWSRNATIYEVNIRQYTEAGTFAAFAEHLPRLKEMGVKILWLMPIHPIGEKNRKGTLGSYYAVKDYLAVNPDYGTLADFKRLVQKVHEMDMYLILDWVANHCAWDNPLVTKHPDWFTRDASGNMMPPVADWSDVVDFNFDVPEFREYMIRAMKYWVEAADIDGYRCDVAGMVPLDFWRAARAELDRIKPVFMLAEADEPPLHDAFDMSYDWGFHHQMNAVARGEKNADSVAVYLQKDRERYPPDAYRMQFTSNHDENSWNGTVFERLGDGAATFAVLSATIPGMPLVYSGQEAGLNKRLKFFEKDVIVWRDHPFWALYKTLLNLHQNHRALWNGTAGGELVRINAGPGAAVFAFSREKAGDKIVAIFNLTPKPQRVTLSGPTLAGEYSAVLPATAETARFTARAQMRLEPWEYRLYVNRQRSMGEN